MAISRVTPTGWLQEVGTTSRVTPTGFNQETVSAGGVTFKPAWARNSNQIIKKVSCQ